ncbi:MAG: RBBP9/YdeN family alpha/beta hydrolase [Minisyncoccia bacterium]
MKTAVIIHGMPSREEYIQTGAHSSEHHWLPWIKKELELKEVTVYTPEMPEPYEPNYERWKMVFEQFPINEETVLIGHSCGAGFLVRWLSENNTRVGKVILVAPWMDPDHEETALVTDFFEFTIDPFMVEKTKGVTIFISSDDDAPMLKTVELLKENITGIAVVEFSDKGHFVEGDMGTNEFPELLKEVLNP